MYDNYLNRLETSSTVEYRIRQLLTVQINTALNRERVELQFDQSYQFEVTTVPLGLHYITS
jgi:hypothetical protein